MGGGTEIFELCVIINNNAALHIFSGITPAARLHHH